MNSAPGRAGSPIGDQSTQEMTTHQGRLGADTIARYITHNELEVYARHGWRCSFYGWRGDNLECFIASFRCCG